MEAPPPPVTVLGENHQSGVYLLRVRVARPVEVVFGKFLNGQPVLVPAGTYVYIGSASGVRGSAALAHRLMRHATRRAGAAPHAIQDSLLAALRAHRLGPPGLQPPSGKKLFWHIDFLLESPAAALSHILILRGDQPLERALARQLACEPGVGVVKRPGGAGYTRGQCQKTIWWEEQIERLGKDLFGKRYCGSMKVV